MKEQGASQGAQTADRAIQLLLLVSQSDEPLSLSEISRLSGFNISATYRLIQVLAKHSFLTKNREQRYVVGGGLVALAASVMQRLNVREVSASAMERLRKLTSETVSLYVRNERHRICVAVVEGLHAMRWVVPVGDRQPLHVGLTGKVILAFLTEAEIAEVLDSAEPGSIDRDRIGSQMARVRKTGYLVGVGDRMAGVGGLSVPIFDASGVAAALTISGPGDRFTKRVAEQTAAAVIEECNAISVALGAQSRQVTASAAAGDAVMYDVRK
jgi:IclR family acetate operon transcriptional repressor